MLAIVDVDSMLHIVANVHYASGNIGDEVAVRSQVKTFIHTIKQNCKADKVILMYQAQGHQNFRNTILPEYKNHRKTSEAMATWKSTILDQFDKEGALGLHFIETDDAQSILAEYIGYSQVVLVTGDKDMEQVPCMIYNPFKPKLSPEDRWKVITPQVGELNLYIQAITGDPTDMPSNLCGVEGIARKTALKAIGDRTDYVVVLQELYTNKYGAEEGFIRAQRTYQMVRTMRVSGNEYVPEEGLTEMDKLLEVYKDYIQPGKVNQAEALFGNVGAKPKLFY